MTAPTVAVIPHLRLTWGGSIGTPAADIWANGLAFRCGPESPSELELQSIAQVVVPNVSGLITDARAFVSPAVRLEWVKAVWVLSSGKQRDVNTALYELTAAQVARGGSAIQPPWFQTYAVTLRTAKSRGRGHAGRIFPPPCGPMLSGELPYAGASFADGLAALYAHHISAMQEAIQVTLDPQHDTDSNGRYARPIIVSRASERWPLPDQTDITGAVVDRVADVQHRRTNRVLRSEGALAVIP